MVTKEDRLKVGEERVGEQADSPSELKDKAKMSVLLWNVEVVFICCGAIMRSL